MQGRFYVFKMILLSALGYQKYSFSKVLIVGHSTDPISQTKSVLLAFILKIRFERPV
jgi:hypothetical protein